MTPLIFMRLFFDGENQRSHYWGWLGIMLKR